MIDTFGQFGNLKNLKILTNRFESNLHLLVLPHRVPQKSQKSKIYLIFWVVEIHVNPDFSHLTNTE